MATPLLLLDFGGVCLVNPVELHQRLEQRLGLPAGTFTWTGPVDPTTDELWQSVIGGELTERAYWALRASEVGDTIGRPFGTRDLMRTVYDPPIDQMIRPGCIRTLATASTRGWNVAVLSNDLHAFHGREWAEAIPILQQIGTVLDCSEGPALKPDRRAYEWALGTLRVDAAQVVFVDDQPVNVAGAQACGIESIWFDVADAERCWDRIEARLT